MSEMDVIQRCGQMGWIVQPHGAGWELLGNGAPALFGTTDSLEAWLAHQERQRKAQCPDMTRTLADGTLVDEDVPGEAQEATISKKKQDTPETTAVAGWPKSPIDQANYERDDALERLQALQLAVQPFLRGNWGNATELTLTIPVDTMRYLNRAYGNGYAVPGLRLDAALGRKVKEMPIDTALWNADGAWFAGRWDGQQWTWEREIVAELALELL